MNETDIRRRRRLHEHDPIFSSLLKRYRRRVVPLDVFVHVSRMAYYVPHVGDQCVDLATGTLVCHHATSFLTPNGVHAIISYVESIRRTSCLESSDCSTVPYLSLRHRVQAAG